MLIRNHYFKPENKTDNSDFTIFCTKIGSVSDLQELLTWSSKKIFGILPCLVTLLPNTSKEYKLLGILKIHKYFKIACIVKKLLKCKEKKKFWKQVTYSRG